MRKQDKYKVIMEANQRLEEKYLGDRGLLKEDILELKQMSKQMYSFLKKKGFDVKIKTEEGEVRSKGITTLYDLSYEVQLIVQTKAEVVWVIIPVTAVVKLLFKDSGENWFADARKKLDDNNTKWINSPETLKYAGELGNELLSQLKSKYPNMKHDFSKDGVLSYIMRFGYGETRKGGQEK